MTDGPRFQSAPRPLHTGRLLLTTRDAQALPPIGALRELLSAQGLLGAPVQGHPPAADPARVQPGAQGLLGEALQGAPMAFAPGDGLLQLIGFSGCAVTLPTAGSGGAPTLHLRLLGPYPAPRMLIGRNSRPPRCPGCGKTLADWRAQVAALTHGQPPRLHCTHCSVPAPPWEWHWRGQAGWGGVFLACEEVFPGEGQPLPRLFKLLEGLGVGPWQHFYVQD